LTIKGHQPPLIPDALHPATRIRAALLFSDSLEFGIPCWFLDRLNEHGRLYFM